MAASRRISITMGWGVASGATDADTDEVFSISTNGPMNDIRTTKIEVATAVTRTMIRKFLDAVVPDPYWLAYDFAR